MKTTNTTLIKYFFPAILLFVTLAARAQFSVMIGGTLQNHTGAPKDYPDLLGFSPRLTMDIGKKSQIGVYSGLSFPVTWKGEGAIKMPQKAPSSDGIGVLEFSTMYSYFFWHENFSNLSAYGSAGPGISYYNANFSTISGGIPHRCADVVLDLRAGVQGHITIGWLFFEGRVAPKVFSIHHVTEEKRYGPLTGINLGLRFLLNRHPYCAN
jgi:hypothetical protein